MGNRARSPVFQAACEEELLVGLVAEGVLSYDEIAERLGVSAKLVSSIATGRPRADLHERICHLVEAAQCRARRLGAAFLDQLVARHAREARQAPPPARKCRLFLKKHSN